MCKFFATFPVLRLIPLDLLEIISKVHSIKNWAVFSTSNHWVHSICLPKYLCVIYVQYTASSMITHLKVSLIVKIKLSLLFGMCHYCNALCLYSTRMNDFLLPVTPCPNSKSYTVNVISNELLPNTYMQTDENQLNSRQKSGEMKWWLMWGEIKVELWNTRSTILIVSVCMNQTRASSEVCLLYSCNMKNEVLSAVF